MSSLDEKAGICKYKKTKDLAKAEKVFKKAKELANNTFMIGTGGVSKHESNL